MALPNNQWNPSGRRLSRIRRATASRPNAASAVTVIGGVAVFVGLGALAYHVSTLSSSNSELKSLAGAAESQTRAEQAKRLLESAGVARKSPATTKETIASAAPSIDQAATKIPASQKEVQPPGLFAGLWLKFTGRATPTPETATPSTPPETETKTASSTNTVTTAAQNKSEADNAKTMLERIHEKPVMMAKPAPPVAVAALPAPTPPSATPTPPVAAAPVKTDASAPGGFDALLRSWGLRPPPKKDSAKVAAVVEPVKVTPEPIAVPVNPTLPPPPQPAPISVKEPAPPQQVAAIAIPAPPPPAPVFVLRPFDTAALARFLLSEHDLSPVPEPRPIAPPPVTPMPVSAPPISPPLTPPVSVDPPSEKPMVVPPPVVATPSAPPFRAVAVPRSPSDNKRRQSGSAECTAIIEKAQLGELTEVDRQYLQERCR